MPPGYGDDAGRGRKAEYTLQRYVNPLIRLKFSKVHVMASRVVYRFCLSKLKIFNKNYKGLGTTEKEKKQEETQTGR